MKKLMKFSINRIPKSKTKYRTYNNVSETIKCKP